MSTQATAAPTMFDPVFLQTEHVKIRPLASVSWQKVAEGLLYENSFHALNWGIKTPQDYQKRYENALAALANQKGNPLVFLNLAETEVLGVTNFMNVEPHNKMIEIGGTWINRKYQKTFVNTETKQALLQYCFETLFLHRVEFRVDAENINSQRAVERLGFSLDGILPRRTINATGKSKNYHFYSVTDLSWPKVKERIQELQNRMKLPEADQLRSLQNLRRQGNAEVAFREVCAALERFPRSAEIHYLAASLCDADRTEQEAVPFYEKALDLGLSGTQKRDAYLGLGSTFRSLGEYQKSARIFETAMAEFPAYRPFQVFHALTLFNLGKPEKAIEILLENLIATTRDLEIRSYEKALKFYSTRLHEVFP